MAGSGELFRSFRSFRGRRGWLFLYVALFLAVCCLPLAGLLAGYENPNLEKRSLAPLPVLMAEGRPNLLLPREFEDYYADHFAFRSWLVSGYNWLNQHLLGQSGNAKVIAGKDGWLFFAETLPDYLAYPVFSPSELRRLATILAIQQEYLAGKEIDFHFVVVPNKISIYGSRMPDRYKPVQTKNNLGLWLTSNYRNEVSTIDLLTPLRRAAADSPADLYHRTDSHWNNLGARIGCQIILSAIASRQPGFIYDDYQQVPQTTRTDWQGDLAAMLYPAGSQLDVQHYLSIPQAYRTQKPMRSLEDLLIQTAGTREQDRPLNLLMFRDSFANALIPFLANAFKSVTFTREIPYNYTKLDQEKPDVVLLEIAERNMPQLLLRAPILPAPERKPPDSSSGTNSSGNAENSGSIRLDRLIAEPGGNWLKISGQVAAPQSVLDAVERIYLGLTGPDGQVRYYEAFPVNGTDTAAPGILGLTAHLLNESWVAGPQVVQVWLQANNSWQGLDAQINLPAR